jgi:hypothetical protein
LAVDRKILSRKLYSFLESYELLLLFSFDVIQLGIEKSEPLLI